MKSLCCISAVVGMLILAGCGRHESKERQAQKAESEWEKAVNSFAKQHGAVLDWEGRLPQRAFGRVAFSVDVANALIRSNRQPVLVMTYLKDIAEKAGIYTAYFSEWFSTNHLFQLTLELKCTQEQADQLLRTGKSLFLHYALVARIDEVSRPRFEVRGVSESDMPGVELEFSPDVFCAKGVCLDFLVRAPEEAK